MTTIELFAFTYFLLFLLAVIALVVLMTNNKKTQLISAQIEAMTRVSLKSLDTVSKIVSPEMKPETPSSLQDIMATELPEIQHPSPLAGIDFSEQEQQWTEDDLADEKAFMASLEKDIQNDFDRYIEEKKVA